MLSHSDGSVSLVYIILSYYKSVCKHNITRYHKNPFVETRLARGVSRRGVGGVPVITRSWAGRVLDASHISRSVRDLNSIDQ